MLTGTLPRKTITQLKHRILVFGTYSTMVIPPLIRSLTLLDTAHRAVFVNHYTVFAHLL